MRSMRFLTLAALSCLPASLAWGEASEKATSSSVAAQQNPSVIDLDANFAAIAPSGPGCVAGTAVTGAAPVVRAYGLADLEHLVPLMAESILETGSLAKQFTAAAMLLLAQDGKLSIDDDIRRYLPEMPDYGTPITIRHLLTHSSGLREQWTLLALTGNGPGTQVHDLHKILELASRQRGLNFRPGAEFLYTNTNYALAAMIIERVSGTSLQRFTEQRLFQPLGMRQSRWREDFRTIVPGRAVAYAPADGGFIANMPFTNVYGNGGLLTTIGDLLRWNAFLDHPSDLPGGEALVAALQTPGKLRNGTPLEYALGLEVTRAHGLRLIAHSGSTAGYKTWLGRYPEKGISVAIMCNNGGVDPVAIGEGIAEEALRASGYVEDRGADPVSSPVPPSVQASPIDLTPYQGLFRNPVTGELVETKIVGARLMLQQGAAWALAPAGEARFQLADGGNLRFGKAKGRVIAFTLGTGASSQRFVAVAPARMSPAALNAYVGTYYSSELDRRISVVREGNALVMRQPFAVEWQLAPRFADGFTTRLRGTTSFVFVRTRAGKIDGFSVWANGVRNMKFVRQP